MDESRESENHVSADDFVTEWNVTANAENEVADAGCGCGCSIVDF